MPSLLVNPGSLTDAQARNLVIKALRAARRAYRAADTAGEKEEREYDRLIKRKTRINANSLDTLVRRYMAYQKLVEAIQIPLNDAIVVAKNF